MERFLTAGLSNPDEPVVIQVTFTFFGILTISCVYRIESVSRLITNWRSSRGGMKLVVFTFAVTPPPLTNIHTDHPGVLLRSFSTPIRKI